MNQQYFDLVLMDVQMPEMDGFEAALAIRAEEKNTGRHIPIIAMTASAIKGDRERCLAAGMDDYVPKPVRAETLFQAIRNLTGEATAPPTPSLSGVLDEAAMRARTGNDTSLLRELADLFLQECPRLLTALRDAVTSADALALERAAHALKGVVGNFAAQQAFQAAEVLETMGRESELCHAAEAYARLEQEIEQLQTVLGDYKNEFVYDQAVLARRKT
jgi:CheY-like chemotaxis protein